MGFGEAIREFGVKVSLAFDKKKVDEAQQKIDKLGSQLKHFSFEVAAAASSLFAFAKLSGSNARDLQQNADLLGINVEKLQELEYAAKVAAGVSRGELVGALESVSETMDRARHGDVMASEGLLRLAQSGVGVDKMLTMLKDKSTTSEQVMIALSQSFKNIKDPLAAARLATEAFGGAGAKLLPLLKQGPEGFARLSKEARSLGVVMGKDSIDAAAAMDREFTKIAFVLKNVTYTIGNQLLKYLKPMIMEFERFIVTNKKLIAVDIAKAMEVLGRALMVVFRGAISIGKVLGNLIDKMGGVENAVQLVIGAFVAFQTIKFVATVAGIISSVASLGLAFLGAIPGIISAGIAIVTAIAPFLLIGAAIGAAVVAVHDLWKILSGGSLKDTWIGQVIIGIQNLLSSLSVMKEIMSMKDKLVNGASNLWGKATALLGGSAANANGLVNANASASPIGGGSPTVNQEFHLNTENNIGIPPGTTASQASNMIAGATDDSHSKMMIKAKNDATRGRQY